MLTLEHLARKGKNFIVPNTGTVSLQRFLATRLGKQPHDEHFPNLSILACRICVPHSTILRQIVLRLLTPPNGSQVQASQSYIPILTTEVNASPYAPIRPLTDLRN